MIDTYHFVLNTGKNTLNDFIQHYEGLSYDSSSIEHSHQRARRSLDSNEVRLQFNAHGRCGKLFLANLLNINIHFSV